MKILLSFVLAGTLFSCKPAIINDTTQNKYAAGITAKNLRTHLYTFAGDEMEGRMTGSAGQKKAAKFIKDFYISQDIATPFKNGSYYQPIPADYFQGYTDGNASENVLAFIEGHEKPEEVIVISAHLDHMGMDNEGNIFNGADDDGSGTVAIMEIAKAFKTAVKDGKGPKRSILFLHVTGEEIGLFGSRFYVENPVFPLKKTVCNLNIDMIGRIDPEKEDNPEYLYLIGSSMLSKELKDISEEVNRKFTKLELDYKYDDPNDPNRFYYRSDHYNFAKNNIPVIFYFNGVHADYHKITDTPDKIDYDLMSKRTQLIFHTAWEIANRADRLKLDKE